MLEDAENEGFAHIISWIPGGHGFKVHDSVKFTALVLPKYFDQKHFKSFQRQLHIYSFERITVGCNRGAYRHELFVRHAPDLCAFMTRTKVKRIGYFKERLSGPQTALGAKISRNGKKAIPNCLQKAKAVKDSVGTNDDLDSRGWKMTSTNTAVCDTRFTVQGSFLMRRLQEGGRYGKSINKPTSLYSQLEAIDPLPISNSDSSSTHGYRQNLGRVPLQGFGCDETEFLIAMFQNEDL